MARLGLRLDLNPELTSQQLVDLVRLAEGRAYETMWVPEGGARDALTHIAAFAGVTQRMRLGTGVLPVFSRTPTATAMSAASLDGLSNHRFILGLGVGHQVSVEGAHGVPFARPVTRTRETVEIVRRLLRGERLTYRGRIFNIANASLGLGKALPVPIYLAALGPQMVELAGEVADGVLLNWAAPSYITEAMERVEKGARKAGRNLADLDIALYIRVAVSEDTAAVSDALRRQILSYFGMEYYRNYFEQTGFKDEVQAVNRYLAEGNRDRAASAITGEMQRELAVFGSAEFCRKEVQRRAGLGLTTAIIAPFAVGDALTSYKATIAAF